MKLGSGFAPIPKMLAGGINVALGTDGAASNNNLNLWEEMHLSSIIHNGYHLDAEPVSAREVLAMGLRILRTVGVDPRKMYSSIAKKLR